MKMDKRYAYGTVLSSAIVVLLAVACTSIPQPGPAPSAQESVAEPTAAQSTLTEVTSMGADRNEWLVTELTFAGNGDTFLERIDETAATLDAPVAHRFVEVTDAGGGLWQGEALLGDGAETLLLQALQSGGDRGVKIEFNEGELGKDGALDDALRQSIAAALPTAERPAAAPDVRIEFVRARQGQPGVWSFDVTLNHPDTGWEDYADGWHVATADGAILGTRILLHPHTTEMPFTRSLSNVTVPAEVTEVLIRAHDLVSGYDPDTVRVPLGESGSGERYEVSR